MYDFIHHGAAKWEAFSDEVVTFGDDPARNLEIQSILIASYFPKGARGAAEWSELSMQHRSLTDFAKSLSASTLSQMAGARPTAERFRKKKKRIVFLSHRHADKGIAEDLAKEIERRTSFRVWLDVWDPMLSVLPSLNLSRRQEALLIAHTIEMGLLNSDGVIALITTASKGSDWIPYEYGRIKENTIYAHEAASASHVPITDLPDYMLLGEVHEHGAGSSDLGGYSGLRDWLSRL